MTSLRKLERDFAHADLAAVQGLLAQLGDEDIMARFGLEARRDELQQTIEALDAAPDEPVASAALFFGGGPVIGARGIESEFAGSAVTKFQDIVAKGAVRNKQIGHLVSVDARDYSGGREYHILYRWLTLRRFGGGFSHWRRRSSQRARSACCRGSEASRRQDTVGSQRYQPRRGLRRVRLVAACGSCLRLGNWAGYGAAVVAARRRWRRMRRC